MDPTKVEAARLRMRDAVAARDDQEMAEEQQAAEWEESPASTSWWNGPFSVFYH